jgi:hypothetical protein
LNPDSFVELSVQVKSIRPGGVPAGPIQTANVPVKLLGGEGIGVGVGVGLGVGVGVRVGVGVAEGVGVGVGVPAIVVALTVFEKAEFPQLLCKAPTL